MKIIKIAAWFASSLIIVLFALILSVENPEIDIYEKSIKTLMQQEAMDSKHEIERCFPTLIDIRANMKQVAELNYIIANKSRNPASIITEIEMLQLIKYRMRVNQLRNKIRISLLQLINANA